MLKRFLSFFLVIALSLAAAQAPNPADYNLQEGKPFEGTELNFLICCTAVAQFAALIERTEEFTEMTGITVNWSNTPYESYKDEILIEASSGTGNYDLVAWVDSWGPQLEPFLTPIGELAERDGVDTSDFPEVYLEAGSFGGETLYGLPLRGHAFMLWYREDVLNDLGLEVPTTWQEVEAAAQQITEQTDFDGISLYYTVGTGQNLFPWLSMLWGAGGDIFDEEGQPIFNNEVGVEATQLYADFVREGLTAPDAVASAEQDAWQAMAQGRAAMFPGWSWIYESLASEEFSNPEVIENLGFVAAPGWEGGERTSYGYIWPVGIFASSNNQDASWEYLKWLTSAKTDLELVLDESDPSLDTVVTTHYSALTSEEVNATTGGLQEVMASSLREARTQPLIPEWLDVQSVIEVALNEIANGADVQETLDNAAADVTDIMERAGAYSSN